MLGFLNYFTLSILGVAIAFVVPVITIGIAVMIMGFLNLDLKDRIRAILFLLLIFSAIFQIFYRLPIFDSSKKQHTLIQKQNN